MLNFVKKRLNEVFHKNNVNVERKNQKRKVMQIYDLTKIPESILGDVGGKAKGLYMLNKFSFNVPKGFILMGICEESDFETAYEQYEKSGLEKVAVRSSATREDGENYSNAGQYETVLNVEGKEGFINAVKDCISSLGNFRSQKYSKMFLSDAENKMTVVVQQMINASCAGVIFTKDPMDKSAVLIECVKGLGEALVSGAESAEQYKVINGEFETPENAILTKEQTIELYNMAVKAEKDFGMPMDIEWAIDEKGEIFFLQARPITVSEDDGVTISEFDFPFDVTDKIITTCNVREMLPNAVTPLSLSTSVFCLDYGMRKLMAKNHAIKNVDDLPPFSCITPFYNNMFFNQSTNYINAYRIAGTRKETSDIVICGRVLDEFPDKFADYSSNFKRAINLIYFLPYVMSGKRAKNGIDKVVEELKFNYDDTIEGLYQQTIDNFDLLKESFFHHYCSSYFSGATSMMAVNALTPYYPDYNAMNALLAGALSNIEGVESAQIIEMLRELAGCILEENPEAGKMDKEQLADYIKNSTGKVKDAFEEFMKINGHRGISETEMRVDCWADDILGFCDSLRGVIVTYYKEGKKQTKTWSDYLDELVEPVVKSKRKKIRGLIEKARSGAWHREYTKSRCMLTTSLFRKAYRLIAEKLIERSILPDMDLIYFFTKEEIGELIKGDKSSVKKALKRRRLYPIQCSLRFEEVYSGKPIPIKDDADLAGKTDFQGLPASPGVVAGKARLIRSVEDANKLQEGEIMVASCTDVGWTPYYCVASGLITEIGSCLSHGVVVAREYGLPTVVNVRGIMSTIKDGDFITMDGGSGIVSVKRN